MLKKKSRRPTDPLERSIWSREAAIKRMKLNIKRKRGETEAWIAEVEKRILEKEILLAALKRGKLKK